MFSVFSDRVSGGLRVTVSVARLSLPSVVSAVAANFMPGPRRFPSANLFRVLAREATPHNDVARRRVLGACKIAANPGDFDEISLEGSGGKWMGGWIGDQAIEDARLL